MRDILTILLYDGQLGTCMAWAMGYYYRTYLRASALNLSADDLAKPENQFSPKYLYIIAAADGADYSEGLNRTRTLNALKEKDIATMKIVPYEDFDPNKMVTRSQWDEEAANYKILSY